MYVGEMDISSIRLKFWLWFRVQGWVPRGARFFDSVPNVLITHEQIYGISLRSE